MVGKLKVSDGSNMKAAWIFVFAMYLFVFQQLLQLVEPAFKYADELFSCIAVAAFALDVANRREVGKENIITLVCMGIVVLSGLWSSWIYQLQPANIVFSDLIVVIKFYLTMYAGERLFSGAISGKRARRVVRYNCMLIICVLALLVLLDYVFDLFKWDERYGMRAIRLFYQHQTFLVAICVFLMTVYAISAQKRMRFTFIVILCVIMALTLRAKAFGMVAAAIAMYILTVKLRWRLNLVYIVFLVVAMYLLVGNQIELYYGGGGELTARTALNQTSLRIARDMFPFGTGFGTFGSHYSGVEYSPVYSAYGIQHVWGISEDMHEFISDTFWPMILGQFGVIGLAAYIVVVAVLFLRIQRLARGNRYIYYGAVTAFIYLIISSTAESAFVNTMAVPLGLGIGTALSDKSYIAIPKGQSFLKTLKTRKFYKK